MAESPSSRKAKPSASFGDAGYRVMSPAEFAGASKGEWADGPLVAGDPLESGRKWLWTNEKEARSWADFLRRNGETDNSVSKVPTSKALAEYPQYEHTPEGRAVHVPLKDLGPAEALDN